MKTFRSLLCTTATAASVVLLAAWALPAPVQDTRPTYPPVTADGNYNSTNPTGNYQAALDAALTRAHDALSHKGGQVVSDLMFNWQVYSVTGTYGGIAGKRDVTVTIHVQ